MFAIGEASRRSGVSVETIRYYEREGIVPEPGRTTNGRRVYSDAEIAQLRFIKRCRELGFGIADAKALLALSEGTDADCGKVHEVGTKHLANVRSKISELTRLEAALEELVANCRLGSASCPMLENLKGDKAGG
jgi:MerR family mercuric resistance operon transcriptional regulator